MSDNRCMPAGDRSVSLRERKKHKTREAIRREAFRLFDDNGYANTTVEEIADAAEVSPSTFFRYFPSKESVLLADDMDPVMMAALERQPAHLSPVAAVRRAAEETFATMSEDQWELERTRQRLVFSIPEIKAAQYDEYYRTIRMLADALSRRLGRDRDDFELRVFAGALAGGIMGGVDQSGPLSTEDMFRALDFLEKGMPLT
ncbi:MAG: TetR family transcriptional regulator [Mycobacteriaceae bacterium]|nr:TetR family transcriptional regulator [Mycobacteriaceae bacterium]